MSVFGSIFLLPLYLQTSLDYTPFQAGAVYLPMGILQGIAGPVSGILSDRINPKLIALAGILLLGLSWYLNGFLSLYSMHSQIMFPLYLRGLGMGLTLTPLTALGLRDIRIKDMGQATGLYNVVRQIGGSFGVAIIGSILTERTLFHRAVDGQVVSKYSPVYQNIINRLRDFVTYKVAGPLSIVTERAKALIITNVAKQAIIQATDDTFFFACAIMLLCVIPILLLKRTKKGEIGGRTAAEH
ncbi:MAG: MFS transporter [Bacteroidetes bacterium]|nr:MFS transporter [Bacteroidota bacterium]